MKATDIKMLDLSRLRELVEVPSVEDDLLIFQDMQLIPELNGPRRMNYLAIGICSEGGATYTVNQKPVKVGKNDALILTEGQVVDNISISEDCKGLLCLISYPFLYEIVKDVQNLSTLFLLARRHPVFAVQQKDIVNMREYMQLILRRIATGDYRFRKDVIRMLLVTMIYDLGDTFYRVLGTDQDTGYTTRAEQIFVHFLQLVEHHFVQERRVSWYAEQMGITPKYLSETVSGISKHSPNDWIERYVTTEIRNQLRKTTKKISQIAKDMNFPNQSFLGKYFKENVGMSPSDYRKQGKEIGK